MRSTFVVVPWWAALLPPVFACAFAVGCLLQVGREKIAGESARAELAEVKRNAIACDEQLVHAIAYSNAIIWRLDKMAVELAP